MYNFSQKHKIKPVTPICITIGSIKA